MSPLVGPEVQSKLLQPLKFQWGTGGQELPPTIVLGFDVTTLIDVCEIIIRAESLGALHDRHRNVVSQARVILTASAKSGIKNLVYALAGYSPSTQEVIDAFKMYVQEEAKKYEKGFPNELYEQWHRLYRIPVPVIGKPWNFKHLTVKHIYAEIMTSYADG